MEIVLKLPADTSMALRQFAREIRENEESAAALALREYLISVRALELPERTK